MFFLDNIDFIVLDNIDFIFLLESWLSVYIEVSVLGKGCVALFILYMFSYWSNVKDDGRIPSAVYKNDFVHVLLGYVK